ncbi:MAG TPA: hypothetical protein VK595_10930, partial [Vicinamibacterales bacterium]|nr:hypothetical protein [Vicinamibacterales bacterium]
MMVPSRVGTMARAIAAGAALLLLTSRAPYGPLAAVEPTFVDAADETGLAFTHVSGATGQYYIPEEMGSGVALFDYDNDGDLDVFLVQGG